SPGGTALASAHPNHRCRFQNSGHGKRGGLHTEDIRTIFALFVLHSLCISVLSCAAHAILALARPMRILTRYILREVTAHALIGVAIFTFVLFTRDLGHILELVVRASAPLPNIAEIFLFTVPLALTYTI